MKREETICKGCRLLVNGGEGVTSHCFGRISTDVPVHCIRYLEQVVLLQILEKGGDMRRDETICRKCRLFIQQPHRDHRKPYCLGTVVWMLDLEQQKGMTSDEDVPNTCPFFLEQVVLRQKEEGN